MNQVRHRSYATYSRQPRQVRKEATVTGSCVCSEFPVPDLFRFPLYFTRNFHFPRKAIRPVSRLKLITQSFTPLYIFLEQEMDSGASTGRDVFPAFRAR